VVLGIFLPIWRSPNQVPPRTRDIGEGGAPDDWSTPEAVRRKECALARLREIEVATAEGKLAEVDKLKALWARIILGNRNMMLSWPSRLAFDTPAMTAADVARARKMVEDDLHDMSWGRGFAIGDDDTAPDDEEDKK
jgi:hypothetical protein